MSLSPCQQEATESFDEFLNSGETSFGLFGYAGAGKSWLTAKFIKTHIVGTKALLAAPTHKAAHVMRRFLTDNDISYSSTIQDTSAPIVGTTAQLLGILPDVDEEQDDRNLKFKKSAKGMIERMPELDWIVVDEVSMLSADQFRMIERFAREKGARVLVIGDPGQLPPVNAKKIKFKSFTHRGLLRTVVRTADGNGITDLATAVRKGDPWRGITGSAVEHVKDAGGTFIANLNEAPGENERDWKVYIAYRNKAVNMINEQACQKLYGHGRFDVREGEVVLSNNNLTEFVRGMGKVPVCTNGETLVVEQIGRPGRWGTNAAMRSVQTGIRFYAEILSEKELKDPDHKYNVMLKQLRAEAQRLQQEYKTDWSVDQKRRQAWAQYFDHKDNTVLSVSHPFALTSHKSQGSSYAEAFVDASDMAHFDSRALYVGATRPSEHLVIG